MAKVPYYRVLELAPWLKWPQPNFPVSNFFHGGAAPLNAILAAAEMGLANNIGIYPTADSPISSRSTYSDMARAL